MKFWEKRVKELENLLLAAKETELRLRDEIEQTKEEVKKEVVEIIRENEMLKQAVEKAKLEIQKKEFEAEDLRLAKNVIEISSNTAQSLYFDVKGKEFEFTNSANLTLNLKDEGDRKFIHAVKQFKLPKIDNLYLLNTETDDGDVKGFLLNSIPEIRNFNFNTSEYRQLEASKYLHYLTAAAKRVSTHFYIYHINMTADEFVELLSSSKNCESAYFYYLNIDSSAEFNVGDRLDGWKTKNLSFNYSGLNKYSGWESDISKLEVIIKGLSTSKDFTNNIKTMYFRSNNMKIKEVSSIMKKYGLGGISVLV